MATSSPAASENWYTTASGLRLLVRVIPTATAARGTILWIHGGCEHGGRYAHITEVLAASGWTTVIPDHRGHGRSEGERTDVLRYEQYLTDLKDIERCYCPGGRADVYFGHSFGGLLAIRLSQAHRQPQALILSAPLLKLKLPVPAWKRFVGRLLVQFAPQTRFRTHINPRNMTRDPEFLNRRLSDPLLIRSVTVRWFFEMQRALADAWKDAAQLQSPTLALQGLSDQTVDPHVLPEFLRQTSIQDQSLLEFPEHVHEVLQEADWRETTAHLQQWLNQRFSPA